MDALKNLVGSKKRELESSGGGATGANKWKKRGDIEKEKVEKIEAERKQKHDEEVERKLSEILKKKKVADGVVAASSSKAVEVEADVVGVEGKKVEEAKLTVKEVVKRLRSMKEPITLFGEDNAAREARMHARERDTLIKKDENMDGQRNIFHEAAAADQRAAELGTTEKESFLNDDTAADKKRAEDPHWKLTIEYQILTIFQTLLMEWEEYLEARNDEEKRSAQGRVDTVNFRETVSGIKPLLQKLKDRTVPLDILPYLAEIMVNIKKREYVKANDIYLKVCIGNAPWPIGVTMVGIHARSAREKIFSQSVAHILNDEATRKYLFSTKRILTFAQKKYPTDPSKMIG